MCIICNAPEAGDDFLTHFHRASEHMRRAAAAMHKASEETAQLVDQVRYDKTHKAMVRLIRQWNRIEHERENDR